MPSPRIIRQSWNGSLAVVCHQRRQFASLVPFAERHIASTAGMKRGLSSVPASVDSWWQESTSRLLDSNVHPVGSFDTLLWHKSETMILYWLEKSSSGLNICFRLLDRLAQEASANPKPQFQLNIYLIHAILGSWNKKFQKFQSTILPSQILAKLEDCLSMAPGLFEPNIATYTLILDGASYCPDPAERIRFSEELLGRLMEESKQRPSLRPTEVTIGTVLKAWSKSGNIQGAEKAEALLRRIIQLKSDDAQWQDLEVNTIHYTTVVSAYANAGEPEPAQRLLREMFEEYLVRGNSKVKPNIRSFNSVLSAWSKTSSPDAFESAEELFVKMGELYESGALEEPRGVISYNCLLNALAKNTHRVSDAVDKAESLLSDLLQDSKSDPSNISMHPTLVTFTALFRILAASNHPEKAEKATQWLEKAKEHGISDERFLLDQYHTRLLRQKRNQKS